MPMIMDLLHSAQPSVGPSSGLCDALKAFGDFGIEHMCITQGMPDIGMVEHPLHEFQVAGLP